MTQCNHEALSFSNCRKRQVRWNFFGGSISSNGGALLLREVDRYLGLCARVARRLGDFRQRGKVRHEVETMVRQRMLAVALGHEDLNDHDALRHDLVVQTACGRDEELASPSTLCRFERRAERQWAIAIHQELVECCTPRYFVADFSDCLGPVDARFVTLARHRRRAGRARFARGGVRRGDRGRDDHRVCGEDGLAGAPGVGGRGR